MRRPEERVRVEEAREGARLETLARVDERPEEVLPGEHAVGEEVEAGLGLGGEQRFEIGGAPALDVVADTRPRSRSRVAWTSASDRG